MSLGVLSRTPASNSSTKMAGAPAFAFGSQQKKSRENEDRPIGWGVRELAEKAGVTANTVTRIENGADAKQSTIDALQRALEAAGIEFTNGDQPGVRLTKAAAARSAEPGSAQSRRVAAKVVRGKTAKANEKKR